MKPSFELIFEHVSDALVCLDQAGAIQAINPAAERLLRIRASEVGGRAFWDTFPQARTADAEAALKDAQSGRRPLKFDLFFPLRYIWVSILAVPAEKGAVLFMRDISDRVRLMQSEAVQERVRAIVEVAPVAITITRGSEHRAEIVNARARELIGHRDIVGLPLRTAFPELEGQGLLEILDRVYETGVPYSGKEIPVSYRPGDATELRDAYFDISYQPLVDTGGGVSGLLSVSVDVTDQVRIRKELEQFASTAR